MYGKYFASTFTGSMVGAGCNVFALWGYCIANGTGGQVELNPVIIATMMGCTLKEIETAIEFLCAPDLKSRSNLEDGRRLIKVGAFAYDIPNYHRYRSIVNEEDRRDYNRRKQAEHRNRVKPCQTICQSSGGSSASPSVSVSASASVPEGGCKGETELPTLEQAIAMVMTCGIPDKYVKHVHDDWTTREGCDAAGARVSFVRYAKKRWEREKVKWNNGTHQGNKPDSAKKIIYNAI